MINTSLTTRIEEFIHQSNEPDSPAVKLLVEALYEIEHMQFKQDKSESKIDVIWSLIRDNPSISASDLKLFLGNK